MIYEGRFKTRKKELIQVIITTPGYSDEITEITLSDENPVIITQTSDGLLSPIKSRSCTISIITREPLFDIYSGSSHGTTVEVNNISLGKCLFYGYATPCKYNQPYTYLDEIEIEAVDAISTLKDFKYTRQGDEVAVSVFSIIDKVISKAGYKEIHTYIPKLTNKPLKSKNSNLPPFRTEYINDEIFFSDDDDHEAISCYEVLEEICNFYGLSCVPCGEDLYFIDYQLISNYDSISDAKSWYNDLSEYFATTTTLTIPDSITKSSYAGDDQNIEIDDVYNKISVEADIRNVEEDDLDVDIEKGISSSTYYNTFETGATRSDGKNWTVATRYFEYIKGSYGGWVDAEGPWRTVINTNSKWDSWGYKLTDNFDNQNSSIVDAYMDFPYTSGYIFNHIVGQCALPSQQFGFEATKQMPYSHSWTNYISFFTQGYWFAKYYEDNDISGTSSWANSATWSGNVYNQQFGGSKPVLYYDSPVYINYSPASSSSTSYLCFTGDLLWQRDCTYDDVRYHMWQVSGNYVGGMNYPISSVGANDTDNAYSKSPSTNNTGWDMLKIRLQIGNKYWNGRSWTTVLSDCWIPYHKESVVGEDETLVWSGWNKPVSNRNYTYKIGKDAYTIPISYSDRLEGRLKLSIFMPKIPWDNQLYLKDGYKRVDYGKIPPVIFMRNLGLSLCTTDNSEKWYEVFEDEEKSYAGENKTDKDEVVYSNDISSDNVMEMDDLKLKINTYNPKYPIAKSYILDYSTYGNTYHTEGFYDSVSKTTQRQELNIVNKYYQHYKSPKKIYNCMVHGYKEPYKCFKVSAIDESTKFVVDEQSYNVKADVNELKLVEY